MFDVSVIIPAYNEEKFIERAINSVLNQTVRPKEIIVVDDGSTDNTSQIVKQYSNDVVKYLYKSNGGLASARNYGISNANQEYIALLDSDDEWNSDFLEKMRIVFDDTPSIKWAVSGYERRLESGETDYIKMASEKYSHKNIIENYFLCESSEHISITNTMVIKKEVFELVGLFDMNIEKFGEDLDMWFRIALRYPTLGWSNSVGCVYWHREGSITKRPKVDIERYLNRIHKTESHALYQGGSVIKLSEPVILDWVWQALKFSIKQKDKKSLKHIFKFYFMRIPLKHKIILIGSMLVVR